MNSKDDSSATHKPNARRSVNADVGKVTVATGSISILADMLAGKLTLFRHVCCITNATAVHFWVFFGCLHEALQYECAPLNFCTQIIWHLVQKCFEEAVWNGAQDN